MAGSKRITRATNTLAIAKNTDRKGLARAKNTDRKGLARAKDTLARAKNTDRKGLARAKDTLARAKNTDNKELISVKNTLARVRKELTEVKERNVWLRHMGDNLFKSNEKLDSVLQGFRDQSAELAESKKCNACLAQQLLTLLLIRSTEI